MRNMLRIPMTVIVGGYIALAGGPSFAANPHGGTSTDTSIILSLIEPKTIFVSSTTQSGNLGGLAGADAICQSLADGPDSIVPAGEYVALLSNILMVPEDGSPPFGEDVNATERLTPSIGALIRPDGVPVAASFAALFSTRTQLDASQPPSQWLMASINRDETGAQTGGEVWTATTAAGEAAANTCQAWTSEIGWGVFGDTSENSPKWIFNPAPAATNCGELKHLYCVQR